MNVEQRLADMADAISDVTGQLSALANPARPRPPTVQTASASVVTGTTAVGLAVGLVGVFAIVVAVACVLVVAAWRDADARVAEARATMQAERNEAFEDRLGIAEAQLRRINREDGQK